MNRGADIQRVIFAATTMIAAAMLLWMGRAIAYGQIPFTGDLLHYNYPLRQFYAAALANGDSLAWIPALYNGFYIAGEGQLGAYHPFHWLLYRFLPLDTAFGIELVAAYPFLFAGMVLFLRRWCGLGAASFGALVFTFSGHTLSQGVHMNIVGIIAHLPWILWAAHHSFTSPTVPAAARWSAVIGLTTGSQLLLGHPQAFWLSLLIVAAAMCFFAGSVAGAAAERMRGIVSVTSGLALGIVIGAVQWLPTVITARESARATADGAFATSLSLPPRYLLQPLAPYLFWGRVTRWSEYVGAGADEFAAYVGAVGLILTAWWLGCCVARRFEGTLDRLGAAAIGLGSLGLWLATGSYGKLYYLQTWLPLVGGFRVPPRYLLFTYFGCGVAAAIALKRLLEVTRTRRPPAAGLAAAWGVVVLAFTLAALFASSGNAPDNGQRALSIALGPAFLTGAAALLTVATRGSRAAIVGLVVLAGLDQAVYGLGGVVAWHDFLTRPEAIAYIDTPATVHPEDGRLAHAGIPNLYTLAGFRLLDGYVALPPTRRLNYRSANALRVAEVAYVHRTHVENAHITPMQPVGNGWSTARAPLERIRLVSSARESRDVARDLERIDVETVALLDRAKLLSGGAVGTLQVRRDRPGEIRVSVSVPGEQLLVVAESFHDGWTALIDGRPAPVERVNGDFFGCVVGTADHEVTFKFQPAHLVAGGWISAAGTATALTLLGFAWLRRPRS